MNMVGRAISTFGKRTLIIRCDAAQLPGLYTDVLDRTMKPVGKIVDIFGNVKAPLATVICRDRCTIRPDEKLFSKGQAGAGRERRVYRKRA
ncbi:MAG: H/ACA RNA-protein complex component Gar1 [Methanoregula sp. PtaU1.Bin051]|nr:MAG: H/ACA RNA-protein complex component Gar1 [Methanoregula sp. PtaU1.Bin051]